jgi:hypothetical protein
MDIDKKVKMLQITYAGVLADTVLQLGKEGVLDAVTERKRQEQFSTGKMRAAQFGIEKPEEAFLKLYDIFGCSNWNISSKPDGFVAQTTTCMLCAIAKKIGAPSPCRIYCLNPMEGIVKALKEGAVYSVEETLWDGARCSVRVSY